LIVSDGRAAGIYIDVINNIHCNAYEITRSRVNFLRNGEREKLPTIAGKTHGAAGLHQSGRSGAIEMIHGSRSGGTANAAKIGGYSRGGKIDASGIRVSQRPICATILSGTHRGYAQGGRLCRTEKQTGRGAKEDNDCHAMARRPKT
jgi:hypothetical protein